MAYAFARKRRSKYGAIPTTVDGIRFDSKLEARRYGELKLLEKAGKIHAIKVHPRFDLYAATTKGGRKVGQYEADFDYIVTETSENVIEDVKGVMTPMARWKIKHFTLSYGVEVKIIR